MKPPLPLLNQIERLLIVKTSSLGDVIHALPAVQALKDAQPALHLGWVVRRRCADLLQGCPFIDNLYVIENKPTVGALWGLRQTLHLARYQMALDMQGLLLSGLLTYLSGAQVRLGWDRNREGNGLFLTHSTVPGKASEVGVQHEVDLLYGFPRALGVEATPGEFPPQHYLAAEGQEQAKAWLDDLPRPWIALNVGAARAYKRWPTEHWAVLAVKLSQAGYGLVFVGDKNDAVTVGEIKASLPPLAPVVDVSGRTSLRELAAVLDECDLVVSGDTGPMHLAVAVGTPVVALFGATDPRRHGPYGCRNTVLSDTNSVTSARPTPEQGIAAMQAIAPETVFAAVRERLPTWP
jgi:heptosyltransferase-1